MQEIIIGFSTEHRPFVMEIVDVMGVQYVACGLMMDFVAFGVEICHQSECHSLGSGCAAACLCLPCRLRPVQWIHGEVDHLVGRLLSVFIIVVRSIIVICDVRGEVADG